MTNYKYPWERWFSKDKFKIYWGKDFDCMPHSMTVQIRTMATEYGKSVSIQTEIEDNGETSLTVEVS